MESICLYIATADYSSIIINEAIDVAKNMYKNKNVEYWLGFKYWKIKEVVSNYDFKVTKLNEVEIASAFDNVFYIGMNDDLFEKMEEIKKTPYKSYSSEEIQNKLVPDNSKPYPEILILSRNNIDGLLDCMNLYKDDDYILSQAKKFINKLVKV